jgi:hypothetical protein
VAVLQVHLNPTSGGERDDAISSYATPSSEGGLEATLTITCLLGTPVPGAGEEGITIAVAGGLNFNQSVGGNTLFIQTTDD